MSYVRKTQDVYCIDTNYGYGWETESEYWPCDYEDPKKSAYVDAKEYQLAGAQVKVVKRRKAIA